MGSDVLNCCLYWVGFEIVGAYLSNVLLVGFDWVCVVWGVGFRVVGLVIDCGLLICVRLRGVFWTVGRVTEDVKLSGLNELWVDVWIGVGKLTENLREIEKIDANCILFESSFSPVQ